MSSRSAGRRPQTSPQARSTKPDSRKWPGSRRDAQDHGEGKFQGGLQALFKLMREGPQFYLPQTDEGRQKYLAMAARIIDDMKKRLDELFITKPKADIVVKAAEKFWEAQPARRFTISRRRTDRGPGCFT